MTVSVSAVFMMPSSRPPMMISTTRKVIEVWKTLSTSMSTASAPRVASSVGTRPILRVRIGATNTEVIASATRSEEHTSELQSRGHLVCRLLLEKKKKTHKTSIYGHEIR